MAPNLAVSQHAETHDMIISGELEDREIARIAQCTERTIRRHRANVLCFGSTMAPRNRSGRPPSITSPMLAALREHLLEKPDEDLDGTRRGGKGDGQFGACCG